VNAVADASAGRPLQSLPSGWTWARLGDICDAVNGRAFKSGEWRKSGLPIVRIQNLKDPEAQFNYFAGELDERHRVRHGDLLFAWSGTPGTSFGAHIWKGPDAALNQHIFNIKFDADVLDSRYLCLALNQNVSRYVAQAQGGVGLAHITKSKFLDSFIPLAPKAKQLELVAELEKQFSRLDEAVANLKRVKANLKRYKAAVLKAAVEGRLVPTEAEVAHREGRRAENGTDLLARILENRRAQWSGRGRYEEPQLPPTSGRLELPSGWVWATAEQLCDFITKGTTPAASKLRDGVGEIQFLKVYNLTFDGSLNHRHKPTFVDRETHALELARSRVQAGDVLINIVGPPLGQVSIVPTLISEANINQAIARYRPISPLNERFLALALMSEDIMRWAISRAKTTAGQSNLTLELCRALPLPLPPVAEQKRIVAEFERCMSIVRTLDGSIDATLMRADHLRRATLSRPFRA
jgi:type I restriction enzyme S subunit